MSADAKRDGPLAEYRRKRVFDSTPEPAPSEDSASGRGGASRQGSKTARSKDGTAGQPEGRFVVHEHHARRLHWDLRLERDGALASWAIPRGIPEDPRHNRKAVHVEDHPLDYLAFEGEIPQGQYGAGTVKIWDEGTYTCEKWRPDEAIVTFSGKRLRGRYALFQAGREKRDWMIHRMDPPLDPGAEEMPAFVAPMLARISTVPEHDSEWAFEVKWDGVRAIASSLPGHLRLCSRNRNDVTSAYPELRALSRALGSHSALLDGEIVAFDDHGRPSFERLQTRMHVRGDAAVRRLAKSTPVTYVLFDLLWLDGHSLMGLPYSERRELLARLRLEGEHWRTPEFHVGDGQAFLAATREQGLEGVVAKRLDSHYAPGRRDGGWLKIKNANRQEAVIGGYTQGKGGRAATIGALHLGVYEDGDLRYVGKVGSGFDERELHRLLDLLRPLRRSTSPFAGKAQPERGARFVAPLLVCEVRYGSWTDAGILRHSVYEGLRDDKAPEEVVRERVVPPSVAEEGARSRPAKGRGARPPSAAGAAKAKGTRRPSATGAGVSTADERGGARARDSVNKHSSVRRRARARGPSKKEEPTLTARTALAQLLEHGHELRGGVEIEVGGRKLKLTNLDKVLYPNAGHAKDAKTRLTKGAKTAKAAKAGPAKAAKVGLAKTAQAGLTKGDLIGYYAAVAPALLPHLRKRPLTLKRYPDGVGGESFFEKQCPKHRPEWVKTVGVWSESNRRTVDYCLCEDLPTLVWLANLAAIELHPSLSRAQKLERPTALAFDLDPGPPAGIVQCCAVALLLRELFDELKLTSYAKTSGSKGVQVYVPLNAAVSYEDTKPFAHAVAELLERRHPNEVVSRMAKQRRRGKVLIDWSQNDEHKTTVAAYSLRAKPTPDVSAPVTWEEVQECRDSDDPALLELPPDEVLRRVAEHGDLFVDVENRRQKLPSL